MNEKKEADMSKVVMTMLVPILLPLFVLYWLGALMLYVTFKCNGIVQK